MNSWQRLTIAGLSLALGCFFSASIVGWHPGDPPCPAVQPPNASPMNWCGWIGAYVAGNVIELLGSAALFGAIPFAAISIAMLRQRWTWRAATVIGAVTVMISAPALAQRFEWTASPTVVGSGGLLGAMLCAAVDSWFGELGSLLVLCPTLFAGLALVFARPTMAIARFATRAIRFVSRRAKLVASPDLRPDTPAGAVAIVAEAAADEGDDETDEDDEDDIASNGSSSRPPFPAIRINR